MQLIGVIGVGGKTSRDANRQDDSCTMSRQMLSAITSHDSADVRIVSGVQTRADDRLASRSLGHL